MKRVVFQGIPGSFSHMAAVRLFGEEEAIGLASFEEAFAAVEKGEADLALLPIENTLAGLIFENWDLLGQSSLQIVGETTARIEHSLMALPGAQISEIREVLSHPKALAQCKKLFVANPKMKARAHFDTAGAAADLKSFGDLTKAAIAHKSAAKLYGLEVLAQGIEDHAENFTRFFLLSRKEGSGNKSTLLLTLDHKAGSLAELLAVFGEEKLSLTQIASRPLIGRPFEYLFFLDVEGNLNEPVLHKLRQKTKTLRVLGRYDEL